MRVRAAQHPVHVHRRRQARFRLPGAELRGGGLWKMILLHVACALFRGLGPLYLPHNSCGLHEHFVMLIMHACPCAQRILASISQSPALQMAHNPIACSYLALPPPPNFTAGLHGRQCFLWLCHCHRDQEVHHVRLLPLGPRVPGAGGGRRADHGLHQGLHHGVNQLEEAGCGRPKLLVLSGQWGWTLIFCDSVEMAAH